MSSDSNRYQKLYKKTSCFKKINKICSIFPKRPWNADTHPIEFCQASQGHVSCRLLTKSLHIIEHTIVVANECVQINSSSCARVEVGVPTNGSDILNNC